VARRPYRVYADPGLEERLPAEDPEFVDLWVTFVHQVLTLAPADEHGPYGIAYVKDEGAYRLPVRGAGGSFGFVYYQILNEERLVYIVSYTWWRPSDLHG
jgi:hypothetical protein